MPSFVSFIPTPPDHISGFFELIQLSPSDIVYDLGSGDGRLLFAALEKGAGRAVGVELDHELVRQAKKTAVSRGLEDRISFIEGDVIEVDLAGASVILCYLLNTASAALKPKFESELRPGTRVIMESFPVLGWKAVRMAQIDYKQFYLYIMPPERTEVYPEDNVVDFGTD